MKNKIYRNLKYIYTGCVIFAILIFVFDVLYVMKNVMPVNHVALESWAIIITLAGIYASIRFLHPGIKGQQSNEADLKKYIYTYYARLASIMGIFIFNIVCLHFTGVKNFIFQSAIVIFALFFCAPDKNMPENK